MSVHPQQYRKSYAAPLIMDLTQLVNQFFNRITELILKYNFEVIVS